MYLRRLELRNFRSYQSLDLVLPPGLVVLCGGNGLGKSNLLEAIYLLALTKSHRAENEREVIRIQALEELPYTRVSAVMARSNGEDVSVQVDMALPTPGTLPGLKAGGGRLQKWVRVNGAPRLASRAVGVLSAVLFSAEDIGLVTGSPAGRRRFLDILASQLDGAYLRSLQRYQKVLAQRNHLLRRIREGSATPAELAFWDGELAAHGAAIIRGRHAMVTSLAPLAAETHGELASGDGVLELCYQPGGDPGSPESDLAERLMALLQERRKREVALGQTLVGPHRDELALRVEGQSVGAYGSRGQMRSVALVLRLAEAQLLSLRLGEEPVLLLDDVLSELDAHRRERVLERAYRAQQALITTAEGNPPPGLRSAAVFSVLQGRVTQRGAHPV